MARMCDPAVAMTSQLVPMISKKHTWKGELVVSSQEDRFSPSRDSLDSGFSSFPASPNSSTNAVVDAPSLLTKCDFYSTSSTHDDLPPPLLNCALYNNQLSNKAIENITDDEDDEPPCKMPHLLPIDEEEAMLHSCRTSSPVLPLINDAENEPKPEAAMVPMEEKTNTFVAVKPKRVRISTPNKPADENEDPYAKCFTPQHPCQWADCTKEFFYINDLYDHTLDQHLMTLQPTDSEPTTSAQRKRIICDDDEELASEKKYRCQWRNCEMTLKRGVATTKFDWLKNHFRTRHAGKAQPFKCLISGCPIRFQTNKALNAHMLNSHDDKPARKTQQPMLKCISCFDYAVPVRTESYGILDFCDKYTFELVGAKVRTYYAMANERLQSKNREVSETLGPQTPAIPRMTTKKTLNVLRKLFGGKMIRKC